MERKRLSADEDNGADDPKKEQQKLKIIQKQKDQIRKLEDDSNKSLGEIQKNIDRTYKFMCALHLDIIADRLEGIDPVLAQKIDVIADDVEKGSWEN
jgi:flagellar motility protein MotE (MotC chaperone)